MTPPSYPRPSLRDIDQTIVFLKIGPDKKVFSVHKEIFSRQSPYFSALFSGHWKEGKKKSVTLNDADPDAFGIVMNWKYTDHISKALVDNTLVQAYIFADRYDVPELRQRIALRFYDLYYSPKRTRWLPSFETIICAFDNLPESSKLCKVFIDPYGDYWESSEDDDNEKEMRKRLPMSFVLPSMTRLGTRALPE
ncbi:hypothetical protein SLS56_005368 [Neofusicoccum ribis]|uniref:BTB domain-containing protein n=1 Tax=Neofusicoccum ribis TaxID=45134 RepID=A0ABR3STX3_9PEZI